MRDETRKALKEMMEAIRKTDSLCNFHELDSSKPIPCMTTEEFDALADALKRERTAKIKYHSLFFQEQGWTQEDITVWLKKAGLE